ncbi:MAG: SPFH domain-containing protein [Clostridia bacterium]
MTESNKYQEKILKPSSGWIGFALLLLSVVLGIAMLVFGIMQAAPIPEEQYNGEGMALIMGAIAVLCIFPIFAGLSMRVVRPNEAMVLILFGKYIGTVANEGFYTVNPFASMFNPAYDKTIMNIGNAAAASGNNKQAQNNSVVASKKISLKAMTLNNDKQKINDLEGNPIEIGVIVIWKIVDTAKAVFNVDDYAMYVSTQSDSAIRHVARQYPYDVSSEGEEKSLRGSSQEIAEVLKTELQSRVEIAGIEIVEARISHLAYAQEIAAAMLQRQQASAIIAARQMIVEGAVGMVEMALNKLNENKICTLDDERKAQMVSNLLVVLCGNKDAQPIVNSGSIY